MSEKSLNDNNQMSYEMDAVIASNPLYSSQRGHVNEPEGNLIAFLKSLLLPDDFFNTLANLPLPATVGPTWVRRRIQFILLPSGKT